jgi:tricorn protease
MTSEYGYREFTRQFGTQLSKEALIIDIRWNQGGHIPFRLIDIFRRQLAYYGNDRRRNIDQRNPGYQHVGPKCFLINGVTQSGGDQLANLVEKSQVGTLLGSRTMGAMSGAGGLYIPFIDGGNSLVPTVGFLDSKGQWIVEGYGVAPNVSVEEDPALMWNAGDSQVDAAIRMLLDDLRIRPVPTKMPFNLPQDRN